ncbi:MAG: hypothetical protein FWD36_02115 [Treponema sp.]|nr:hypothetical protein [Treponema sp.]
MNEKDVFWRFGELFTEIRSEQVRAWARKTGYNLRVMTAGFIQIMSL